MYYRNFSGDLNAMNARGVQNDIALSPRDGEGAERERPRLEGPCVGQAGIS